MSRQSFIILAGVGVTCITAIIAVAGCVKHIVTEICTFEMAADALAADALLNDKKAKE